MIDSKENDKFDLQGKGSMDVLDLMGEICLQGSKVKYQSGC